MKKTLTTRIDEELNNIAKKQKRLVTTWIDADLHERVKAKAKKNGVSVSAVIAKLLEVYTGGGNR